MRMFLIAFVLMLALPVSAMSSSKPKYLQFIAAKGDLQKMLSPVFISLLASKNVIIFTYRDIFHFNPVTRVLRRMKIVKNGFHTKLTPTSGSILGNRLFIANYTANNVLEAQVDESRNRIKIVGMIKSPKMKSPESISFRGDLVAVSNYDSGNLQIFKRDTGNRWTDTCELPVPQAHGLAFVGDYVYAASLSERRVYKVDPVACSVVISEGSEGWETGQYLWPTGVAPGPNGNVLISDAHTGNISIIDPNTLMTIKRFGDNGPGSDHLNMPYAAFLNGDEIWVMSVFQRRIVVFDLSGRMLKSWSPKDSKWSASYHYSRPTYHQYVDVSDSAVIMGECVHPAYGSLASCKEPVRNVPLESPSSAELYFMQFLKGRRGTFVVSPQSPFAIYYRKHGRRTSVVQVGLDAWVIDNVLVKPGGPVDLLKVEAKQWGANRRRSKSRHPAKSF